MFQILSESYSLSYVSIILPYIYYLCLYPHFFWTKKITNFYWNSIQTQRNVLYFCFIFIYQMFIKTWLLIKMFSWISIFCKHVLFDIVESYLMHIRYSQYITLWNWIKILIWWPKFQTIHTSFHHLLTIQMSDNEGVPSWSNELL